MSTEIATPPPVVTAPAPAAKSPPSPVPPQVGTQAAHLEAAKKVFAPDPAKAAPAAVPDKPAAIAPAPDVIESPKKPDAPATPPPVEHPEDKLVAPKSAEAKAGWDELKTMTKTERARAMTAEARVKELEGKAAPTPANNVELEALRTELATTKEQSKAAMDRLLVMDLQNHPDFHKQFSVPKKAALDTAKEVIDYNGKTAPELASLLSKPLKDFNAAVSELTDKMNPADASTVMQSLRQARDIQTQEQAQISKAGELHQQLQQKSVMAQRQAFESVVGDALPKFKKMDITDTMDAGAKEAATKYNQSIDTIRQRAEAHAFGKIDEKGTANLALKAVALEHVVEHAIPAMQRAVADRDNLIASMRAELEAFRGGRAPRANGDPAPAEVQNESIEQAAKRVWGKT